MTPGLLIQDFAFFKLLRKQEKAPSFSVTHFISYTQFFLKKVPIAQSNLSIHLYSTVH